MKALADQAYHELLGRIADQSARDSFHFLLGAMLSFDRFEFQPNVSGDKKSIHFSESGISNYAFIAKNYWLLWYFRKPGFTSGLFDWNELQERFPAMTVSERREPAKAEGTLRITKLEEAESVIEFIKDKALLAHQR